MRKMIIAAMIPVVLFAFATAAMAAESISKKSYKCAGPEGDEFKCTVERFRDEGWDIPGSTRAKVTQSQPGFDPYVFWAYPGGVDCGFIMVGPDFAYTGGALDDFENDKALCMCQ